MPLGGGERNTNGKNSELIAYNILEDVIIPHETKKESNKTRNLFDESEHIEIQQQSN